MKVCTTCGREWPDDTKFCPDDGSTLRPAEGTADLSGTVLADRYHLVRKLGAGGMGTVYLAEHVKMGLQVAIKVISADLANSSDALARFNREAKNAARIKHPNVCQVYGFGETPDGLAYLAMEFIEGKSLADLLDQDGLLDLHRASDILMQCCDAVQTAHDLGIVHRDLKPDNIMITSTRDGSDLVKVVDFGLAKALERQQGQTVTKSGFIVGTPEYMSPEQVSGDVSDGRSDTYTLALVFFRMITGTSPFDVTTPQDLLVKRLTEEPRKLRDASPQIALNVQLQLAVDRALARSPEDRYGSVIEFGKDVLAAVPTGPAASAEAVTHLIDSRDIRAPILQPAAVPTPETPQPISQPARAWSKLPRGVKIGGAAAVVVLGAGTFWLSGAGYRAALRDIDGLIAQGEYDLALERLDVMRTDDVSDQSVNALIRQGVTAEADGHVARENYSGAIATLRERLDERPYLNDLENFYKELHLRKLEHVLLDSSASWNQRRSDWRALNAVTDMPDDIELVYQASVMLAANEGSAYARAGFLDLLSWDSTYREREPIIEFAREDMVATNSRARELIGKYFYEDLKFELLANLGSTDLVARLNAYEILENYGKEDLAGQDLISYHRLNLASGGVIHTRQLTDARLYFLTLDDEALVQEAVATLRTARQNPSVVNSDVARLIVDVAVEWLETAVYPIRVWSDRNESVTIPSRYRIDFEWIWYDVSGAGVQDLVNSADITLSVDGEVVADKSHFETPIRMVEPVNCLIKRVDYQCTHEVQWRYRHAPLVPGEHTWTFRWSFDDKVVPLGSDEGIYSGVVTTPEKRQ